MRRLLRISAFAAGALIGVIILAAVVGLFLPADHQVSLTRELPASPDSVFTVLTYYIAYPEWRSDLKKVEMLPPAPTQVIWREIDRYGQSMTYAAKVSQPPTLLVIEVVSGAFGFSGGWTIQLLPTAFGSEVTITETGRVSNPILRTLMKLFFKKDAAIKAYFDDLQRRMTVGAVP